MFSRRSIVYVFLASFVFIGIGITSFHALDVRNYEQTWKPFNHTYLGSFSAWLWTPNKHAHYRWNADLKLFHTLQRRAINRSNRYYLNDFEYFRIIRDEFPLTDSASRLAGATELAPLLPSTLDAKDVLFIVMASAKSIDRARLLTETWLRWTRGNFFIFTETTNASVPMISLPELQNRTTRADAQHRQLRGSHWLMMNRSDLVKKTKWFMFVDDDTWVNVPALLSYLQLFDHRASMSLGYIWDNTGVPGWSFHSGGAGVVFSQPAFVSVVPAIYSNECPFDAANDVTWMRCQKRKGVTKIHSDRFYPDTIPVHSGSSDLLPIYHISRITFHYITDLRMARRMTCDVAAYWKWPVEGCEDVKRDDMHSFRLREPIRRKL